MRRKCFVTVIILISLVYLLELFNVSLIYGEKELISAGGIEKTYVGRVIKVKDDGEKLSLKISLSSIDGTKYAGRGFVLLTYYGSYQNPYEYLGADVSFTSALEIPSSERNPECFNYRTYLKSERIFLIGTLKSLDYTLGKLDFVTKYQRFILEKRYRFEETLSPDERGIISGMTFGTTSYMDDEIYKEFRNNGTCHILAVSGLHVGILYGIYKAITKKKNSALSVAILAVVLLTYGTLALWSPSIIRAILMICMSITAKELDLRYDLLNSLSFVAVILIAFNPYVIYGTGFQMSFLAIASISFIDPILPKKIPEIVRSSLACNIGLLLYQIYNYNYFTLSFVLANIVVVTLATVFVPLSIAYFGLFVFTGNIDVFRFVLEKFSAVIVWSNKLTTVNGILSFDLLSPSLGIVFLYTAGIFYLASEYRLINKLRGNGKKITKEICLIIIMALAVSIISYSPVSTADVTFIDVGQGDSVRIRDGKVNVLIDGGGKADYNVGEKTLKPYLLKNGAKDIDLCLVTHLHTDHYKGITELNDCYTIKCIKTGLKAGENFTVSGDVFIETIWPLTYDEKDEAKDENSNCSVFIVHYKNYKIMITGDLDIDGESSIIKYYSGKKDLSCDILKIGHHGSKTSTSDEFLDAVNPRYAVIQVGKNNYGHPTEEVLNKLAKRNIIILRNDRNGAIGFRFGRDINYSVMIGNQDD